MVSKVRDLVALASKRVLEEEGRRSMRVLWIECVSFEEQLGIFWGYCGCCHVGAG